jgi:hypothetical protein
MSLGPPKFVPLFPLDEAARAASEAKRLAAELEQRRRWAQHDADFTPPDVARLGAWAVRKYLVPRPRLILGPCAGAGVWLAAAREFFPGAQLRAMDIREEERPHLEHHAGAGNVEIGDFTRWTPAPSERPNMIIDNLPFKFALEFLQAGIEVLADDGVAVWFVRLTLGDRDAVNDWLERHPYKARFEYVDRFKFRVGVNPETGQKWGVDTCGYKLLAFHKSEKPDTYLGKRLPSLPPASRRWRRTLDGRDVRPGTEYLHRPDELEPAWVLPS